MRVRYRQSLIALPVLYLAAACALGLLVRQLDARREVEAAPGSGIGTARDILTATATGMIAFTGFVAASVLVVVQFAAGQYSPRLVLWFRRDALTKHAIGCFLAAVAYALVALRQIEGEAAGLSPAITVTVALALLIGSCVLFLALLQRVTDRLRPRTLFCVVNGPTRGRPWSAAAARSELRQVARDAGVRRRFAPHQLRHAHAVEMAREGVP